MGSINICKPTKDTYKVCISYKNGSIGACSPTETQQINVDFTDTDIVMGYDFDNASSYKVSDVPTQLLRWFVEKNGNKKLQQCYRVFNPDSFDYEVIWKDIEMVYEE